MRILLTNDDGIQSDGLFALIDTIAAMKDFNGKACTKYGWLRLNMSDPA